MLREKPPLRGGLSETSDTSETKPPRLNTQIKFQEQAEAEFDAEIALGLAASGWRVAAALLTLAAKCIEAGDFQSAERNRQSAREQFGTANYVFQQFREARAADGTSLWAEAFL
jgi:hypothetical protein